VGQFVEAVVYEARGGLGLGEPIGQGGVEPLSSLFGREEGELGRGGLYMPQTYMLADYPRPIYIYICV